MLFPEYDSSDPKLLDSFVCFADILGFSNLIKSASSEEAPYLLKDLHSHLSSCYKKLRELNPYGSIKTFTDNIILAYPKHEDGEGQYGSLILSFMYFQLNMILKGYFIRGGISLNDYYGDETFAYGPAVVEAYELESNKANYPRIILSEKMIELILVHIEDFYGGEGAPQISEVICDKEDNTCFINYLLCIENDLQESGDFKNYFEIITAHKNQIETAIYKNSNDSKIMVKYSWVAKYHNYFCDLYVAPKLRQGHIENYKVSNLSGGNFTTILDRVIV